MNFCYVQRTQCLFLFLLALIISLSVAQEYECINDEDCSLNGVCTKNTCICDPGWRSSDCGELDIRPTHRSAGYNFTSKGISSWGARIVHDPKDRSLFHLF